MTKQEKEKLLWLQVGKEAGAKGKKGKSGKGQNGPQEGLIDFSLIKKFNNLKISAPLVFEDYEKTIKDLEDLRFALVYWGKIIQRQKKIKFIKAAIKISKEEEYTKQAEDEEKYIENEKSKFEGDDVANKTDLSLDKLKIAQIIDKESRMNKVWKDEEDDDEEEDSDDAGYTVD